MSKVSQKSVQRKTLAALQAKKKAGQKISMLTCYDAAFARLLENTALDSVLVGDSLGNVIQGGDNTLAVTIEDMIYHTRSVARMLATPFLISDMPFGSYQLSPHQAATNAVRLVQEGGAHAVKIEGGQGLSKTVEAIHGCGIPVVGHLGLQPQSLHAMSGYRVQGRTDDAASRMIADAQSLEASGVSMLVLECIPEALASEITRCLDIPTIGIGAGKGCDGQVLVLHDMLGFDSEFKPKFLKCYADMARIVPQAVEAYIDEVGAGVFPAADNSFD